MSKDIVFFMGDGEDKCMHEDVVEDDHHKYSDDYKDENEYAEGQQKG